MFVSLGSRSGPGLALALATVLGLSTAIPANAAAQVGCASMLECPGQRPTMGPAQDLQILAANALLGGVSAAAVRLARGEPVWRAFWVGAAGGGVAYAGKRIAVQRFDGAGLLGREVASVGGSMVRNVAAGRGAFDEVALPIGPIRLYVSRDGGITPRIDLATVATAASFILAHEGRLDAGASLSSGALVFRSSSPAMPGLSSAGAMLVWSELPPEEGPRLLAHERVHVLQYDQTFLSVGDAAERWVLDRARVPGGLMRYIDVGGLVVGARAGLSMALDYSLRPWEHEAYYLAEQAFPVPTP